MPITPVTLFAADNIINPQNPGNLPAEDRSFRSDLRVGDEITWLGGGTSATVSITDTVDNTFDEAQNSQTLTNAVTFDGISYAAGQIVTPTYTIVFNGDDGNSYTLTSFNFSPNTNNEIPDAIFWEGSIPPPGTVLTVAREINPTGRRARDYGDMVVCFAAGTAIKTPNGERTVETLRPGDLVTTADDKTCAIIWAGMRAVGAAELAANPKLRPIRITAGAMGAAIPQQDLLVSRQHRMQVSSLIAQRMFGRPDALVAAHFLTALPGIYVDHSVISVQYFHLLLDGHEVLIANGAPAESLYLGAQAQKSLSPESLSEIRMLWPGLDSIAPVRTCVSGLPARHQQKRLVARHRKNRQPLIGAAF